MLSFGILGNNARNLHYIKKRNPRKAIRLADNKLETKKFLGERGIPFAKTYAVIKSRAQLSEFDFSQLPHKHLVIKPNHGSKGKGICILKSLGKGEKKESSSGFFSFFQSFFQKKQQSEPLQQVPLFQQQEKILTEQDLKRHCLDILDGKYSMTMVDEVIIEEKLVPGDGFKDFCDFGLADLRIIVFNLVPVAAMIRIPTQKSDGKANLNAGGIGCGIDIGSGKITSMLYKNKIYTSKFPVEFAHYQGKTIPFRNDILFYSSKVQYFVNLGYLALDWVVTNGGPRLLEINARAGLEVQKITDIRLKSVLQKLSDLKVHDPEKGVAIAKTLFSKEDSLALKESKLLYLSQQGKLKLYSDSAEEIHSVFVEVNLQEKKNLISPDIAQRIKDFGAHQVYLELPESDILLKNFKYVLGTGSSRIVLGQKTASRFLLKPMKKEQESVNILNPKKVMAMELAELHLIDDKLEKFAKRFNLTARLRPVNYFAELDRFISAKGNYAPIFDYAFPSLLLQDKWVSELLAFRDQLAKSYLKSQFLTLFQEKVEEVIHKARLLRAYTEQDFSSIEAENIALFGDFDHRLLQEAQTKILQLRYDKKEKKNLTFVEICEYCEQYLSEKGIFGVEIVKNAASFSRMSVSMGKVCKLNIFPQLALSRLELQALLAHEVDIHLMRFLNGKKSGWRIFASGTAHYLKDEEGLAVWNAAQVIGEYEENFAIFQKYYLLHESRNLTFSQLVQHLQILNPEKSLEGIFKGALRCKKGQIMTNENVGSHIWMKDKVYLDGYQKIKTLNPDAELLHLLKKGKIKIEDQYFII